MLISNDVLDVLSNAETVGNAVRLVGQLDRALYTKTNKVLEAAGGKWNRKAKAHLFDSVESVDRLDQIILSGSVEIPKDEFNFFPTPACIVERMLDEADIRSYLSVLEPSAGTGAIALAATERGAFVDCVELMEANYNKLLDYDNDNLNSVVHGDFLTQSPTKKYQRILMNPPFAKQADIKHVNHAMKFLESDGILVAIMSASVGFRSNKLTKDFRDMVEAHDGIITNLPEGSFKESGTMVNTVMVTLYGDDY